MATYGWVYLTTDSDTEQVATHLGGTLIDLPAPNGVRPVSRSTCGSRRLRRAMDSTSSPTRSWSATRHHPLRRRHATATV